MTDPTPLPDFAPACLVDLDLRSVADLAEAVQHALDRLPPGRVLHMRLAAPPADFLTALHDDTVQSRSARYADDDWSVWCWRGNAPMAETVAAPADDGALEDAVLDLRALPPPQPLLAILNRVEQNADDFDVLLPFFPTPLAEVLRPWGRRIRVIAESERGVRIRVERE